MSDIALEFDGVWKKFRKGEIHDSLRDIIPALTRGLFSRNNKGELAEREFWALRDICFQVQRGEAFGIIGPNGAGKSTALKLIGGILRPNKGTISINGKISALIEVGAGFHPDLTGRENIYLNATILGMRKAEINKKFDEIVAFSGLEEFIDTPVKRYSSGMYARLGFSVAAHVDTEILLVDEVLAVGDAEFQKKCLDKMNEVASSGRTIVFISHNLGAVQTLCPRAVLLRRGRVMGDGPTESVVRGYLSQVAESAQDAFGDNPDRSGNGRIRLKRARVLDERGHSTKALISGRPVTIEFEYENPSRAQQASVNFTIFNQIGTGVANFDMALTSFAAEGLGHEGRFLCAIERLPLPIGSYRIVVLVTVAGQVADRLPNALAFDVAASVFYPTGRTPTLQCSACLLDHTWRHEVGTSRLSMGPDSIRSG